jgi:hypothetical protein
MTRSVLRRFPSILMHSFKQPSFRILAAQCVRGLPVPREPREGMERWEAPGCLRGTLGGGINVPTSRGKAPRAPKARRSASQRSTGHPGRRPIRGAPVRPALAPSAAGSLLESGPSLDRTRAIISPPRGTGIRNVQKIFANIYRTMCPGRGAARSTWRSSALQSRGRNERRCLVRSRFCEAAFRKSYALHRARDTRLSNEKRDPKAPFKFR